MRNKSTLRKLAFSVAAALLIAMVLPAAALAAPLAASNLTATVNAGPPLFVTLNWTDNASGAANETGYRVERAGPLPSAAFAQVGVLLPANSITANDTTVVAGNTYAYRVVALAFDATGDSPPSNTVTVTASLPAAPSAVTATAVAGPPQAVNVAWTDNSTSEIGFRIDRAENALFTTNLVQRVVAFNTVAFSDADIIPGTTYSYRVAALSAGGASATVAAAPVTVPAAAGMQAGPAVPVAGFGPNSGFPLYYQDTLGTKLNLLPVTGVNLADGVIAGNAYSAAIGFGSEAFYYAAGAEGLDIGAGAGLFEFAIEAIFLTPDNPATPANEDGTAAAGQEIVMNRVRIRFDVPVSGTYTVTTPYHQGAAAMQFAAVAGSPGFDVNATFDIMGIAPRDFATTTTGPVNVFLRPTVPAAPGLLGDGLTAGTVTGGPGGVNSVTITGPAGITATTNQWLINGRLLSAAVTPSFNMTLSPATGQAPNTVTFADTTTGTPTSWIWDFGDGTPTANVQNPSHTFAAGGNFIVKLTAANAGGQATASRMVSIFGTPVATFTSAVGGTPNTINFTSSLAGNPTGWAWAFGDGTSSNLQNPTRVYATAGTFTVTLNVFNPVGTATSSAVLIVGAPTAPTNLTGVLVQVGAPPVLQINLTWTDTSANETGFRVEHANNAAFTVAHPHTVGANVTTFGDTVTAGSTNFYRVFASSGAVDSQPSNTFQLTASAPGAPVVTATPVSSGQINLSWADVAGETSYRVERAATLAFTAPVVLNAAVAANTTAFVDTTVTPSATFFYRVTAINIVGETASAVVSATTPAAPTTVPAIPTGLSAAIASATSINLTWADNSNNETSFRVERSLDAFATAPSATLTALATAGATGTFQDASVPAGNPTVSYRVSAVNGVGASGPSNVATVSVVLPVAPSGLTATPIAGAVMLTWVDNSNNESGFLIERGTNAGLTAPVPLVQMTAAANATSFSDAVVIPGTTYFYHVAAVNGVGTSAFTAPTVSATPTAPVFASGGGGGGGGGGAPPPAAVTPTLGLSGLTGTAPQIDASGVVRAAAELKSQDSNVGISIAASTKMVTSGGTAVGTVSVAAVASPPSLPPARAVLAAYNFGPDGATFEPPITLTIAFSPDKIPAGVKKESLFVAYWDGSKWVKVEGTVNTTANTITFKVSHFTNFAVMAQMPPTLKMTVPADGAVLKTGNVSASIELANFELAAPSQTNVDGQGHVHYYLDVDIPTEAGKPAVSAPGTYKAVNATSVTWENLKAGKHTLGVQLVNNNHTPLSPPLTAKVSITLVAPPTLSIISPAPGATLQPGAIPVSIKVTDFELAAPGATSVLGQGHVHYYLDVDVPEEPGQPAVSAAGTYKAVNAASVTWDNVGPGTHTLSVQLVNSNHTPLSPPVTAKVSVTVAEPAPAPAPAPPPAAVPAPAPVPAPTPTAPPAPAGMNWWLVGVGIVVAILAVVLYLRRRAGAV